MNEKRSARIGRAGPDRPEQIGERGFSERAERQAGHSDAELHTGNNAMEVAKESFYDARADIPFADQLADARDAYGDERKLRGGEEAVHGDEREGGDKADGKHSCGRRPPFGNCNGTE